MTQSPPSATQPKKPIVRLVKWACRYDTGGDNYRAPEDPRNRLVLTGYAFGHPNLPEGSPCTTGTIIDANGRIAIGRRTEYRLGRIDPKYRKWLKANGIPFDQDNPIKVRT